MDNEAALATIEPPTVHLVARNPQQMAAAQSDLALWLKNRQDVLSADILDLETARNEAKKHKWKTSAFANHISKLKHQCEFYQKLSAAVAAGFTIVPNFPIDVFAIRVDRTRALAQDQCGGSHKADYKAETPEVLSIGEGEYKSPKPAGFHSQRQEKDGDKLVNRWYYVSTHLEDVEFPFAVARPEIMTATAEAMALRVFDQIGICPQTSKRGKGDPLIIGQIIQAAPYYGNVVKPVSFLIAWHLDLRTL